MSDHVSRHRAYQFALMKLALAMLVADSAITRRGRLIRRTRALINFDRSVTGRAYLP